MLRHASFWLGLIFLGFSMSGCGYRLLGSQAGDQPFKELAVVAESSLPSLLEEQVTSRLTQQGITATVDQYRAPVLQLSNEEIGQTIAAVDLGGNVIEYRRFHRIAMTVLATNGEVLLSTQTLVAERRYRFDETRLLASEAEAERIAQSLADELTDRVIMRLYTIPMQR